MTGLVYPLFFLSGLSGLIYQVVWVRVFGNVFGNTVHSTSLVVAVFMLGLGVGGVSIGAWADRRYARSHSLLRSYGYFELAIGLMGLGISLVLPYLGRLSAYVSTYSRGPSGWYAMSASSHLARAAIVVALLAPITMLMGGTLTLLIRHLVRDDVSAGGWRIALFYAVNTLGAAAGALLTDFALVPAYGLRGTQMVAVVSNLVAGGGALWLGRQVVPSVRRQTRQTARAKPGKPHEVSSVPREADHRAVVPLTSAALAMTGFAAMGMEILWFRHFTILLGGFRTVFSLLMAIILTGMGAGSLVSALVQRRTRRPVQWLMAVQALLVAVALLGLAGSDARRVEQAVFSDSAYRAALAGTFDPAAGSGASRAMAELWFNIKPMLSEIGLAVVLMGFMFPLANAAIQRTERSVGRCAGMLYLSNTIGAVCGSLAAGFVLLPVFGMQGSATILAMVGGLAILPFGLAFEVERTGPGRRFGRAGFDSLLTTAGSLLLVAGALVLWLRLPTDYVLTRALAGSASSERLLTVREGLTEVVEVTEISGAGRRLLTNGHPMSATTWLSQRYMRALAHLPLLAMKDPEVALVIGFGVGNTTHAATLHPSIRRVEVADLSRDVLASADYFRDVNHDVLRDPRVVVYVNDGRQHLQMRPPGSYDLITLEPPPIAYAGVAALYSTEFYALARTRLKPGGYVSQWLPAYQVPGATTLAMVRAFIDNFPHAVLVSGAESDLLLLGANDSSVEIDPRQLAAALASDSTLTVDLERVALGSVREIVGTFVGSSDRLAAASRDSAPVTDDRPIQEYSVQSLLNLGAAVPAAVVDVTQAATWCPSCFVDGRPVRLAEGLDIYLTLLGRAYAAPASDILRIRRAPDHGTRLIAGSAYLGSVVPESAEVHNLLGISFAQRGRIDEAIAEFRTALALDPGSAQTHWHLGAALASRGILDEATAYLRRSLQLDPTNPLVRHDLQALTGAVERP